MGLAASNRLFQSLNCATLPEYAKYIEWGNKVHLGRIQLKIGIVPLGFSGACYAQCITRKLSPNAFLNFFRCVFVGLTTFLWVQTDKSGISAALSVYP